MKQFKRFLIAMVVVCAAAFTLVACNEKAKVTFDYNGGSGENYTVKLRWTNCSLCPKSLSALDMRSTAGKTAMLFGLSRKIRSPAT